MFASEAAFGRCIKHSGAPEWMDILWPKVYQLSSISGILSLGNGVFEVSKRSPFPFPCGPPSTIRVWMRISPEVPIFLSSTGR